MILADTSIWVDHWLATNALFARLLDEGGIVIHPMVIGELAMGNLRNRSHVLQTLAELPPAIEASHKEVLGLIERERLYGRGIGFVDAHLLAAARLSSAKLWTLDRRLALVAEGLAISWSPALH
jgi:predicted nucleic acid-binding protein